MAEETEAAETFDGIVDNKIPGMPTSAWVLFVGLIAWGVAFIAYFLLTDYSSHAEFDQKMKAREAAVAGDR